jgi:hypothetical protein
VSGVSGSHNVWVGGNGRCRSARVQGSEGAKIEFRACLGNTNDLTISRCGTPVGQTL